MKGLEKTIKIVMAIKKPWTELESTRFMILKNKLFSNFRFKSMSTRGPGRGDTCHLTDFNETWPD